MDGTEITLTQVQQALDAHDPELVSLLVDLAQQPMLSHGDGELKERESLATLQGFAAYIAMLEPELGFKLVDEMAAAMGGDTAT